MPGFGLLPHRGWHDEKLPRLLKTSTLQTKCFCSKYPGFKESTGSWHIKHFPGMGASATSWHVTSKLPVYLRGRTQWKAPWLTCGGFFSSKAPSICTCREEKHSSRLEDKLHFNSLNNNIHYHPFITSCYSSV